MKYFLNIFYPTVGFLFFLILWILGITVFAPPSYLIPAPMDVWNELLTSKHILTAASWLTLKAAASGFFFSLFIGLFIAALFAEFPLLEKSFSPYAIFLQTVPIVAIAPLIIIWFGTGFKSVVIVSFIISLFPIISNATSGMTRLDTNLIDLFRLQKATRLQTFFKLKLPHALPSIVTGAKISSGLSIIGAIVGEFFAGYGTNAFGLGYLVTQSSGQLKTPLLFAAIFLSALLGFFIFSVIRFIGEVLLRRWN